MIIFNIITGTVTPSSLFKDSISYSQTKILFNDKHWIAKKNEARGYNYLFLNKKLIDRHTAARNRSKFSPVNIRVFKLKVLYHKAFAV